MRVLIVDDNRNFGRFLRSSLSNRGYETKVVSTVRDAVRAADNGSHDLFLIDVKLPDGDGRRLAADLIGGHHATAERIVLTTALERGSVPDTAHLSSHPVLYKPYRLDELLDLLRLCAVEK